MVIITMFVLITNSCGVSVKETNLGNNLYLSEYDCVDRRILYQTKKQSVSGIEIIPMTVSEINYDKKWIIAKSINSKSDDAKYWIIQNRYDKTSTPEQVKENTFGPLNKDEFDKYIKKHKITLTLKQIKC